MNGPPRARGRLGGGRGWWTARVPVRQRVEDAKQSLFFMSNLGRHEIKNIMPLEQHPLVFSSSYSMVDTP